jgi:pimeloyl-ACP methyl ester carboxylesterase
MIICGAEDKMTPLYASRTLHGRIKNSLLQVIDGAGHQVMLEKPLVVANLLHLFLHGITYQPGESG